MVLADHLCPMWKNVVKVVRVKIESKSDNILNCEGTVGLQR